MNDNKSVFSENLRINSGFNNDDISSSHYALKLALQTMKERCQKLQKRLTCLEDENLQLRIERHSVPALVKKEPKSDLSSLQKQVEELNRQKSLLCHHIYMVATENKDLWERLCKVSNEKEMLEINLDALADDSNKHVSKPENSINIVEACQQNIDGKDISLEEISLKILTSIKKKRPLAAEDGDSEEIDSKNGELVRDCEFTLDMEEEDEGALYKGLMLDVNKVLERLKTEKMLLKQQQEGLKSAIDVITNHMKAKQCCNNCVTLQSELDKERSKKSSNPPNINNNQEDDMLDPNQRPEPNFNIPKSKENAFEDRICPLCTKFYPKSTPFDEFNEHVLSHFVEEPEQDSLMSNYELIT